MERRRVVIHTRRREFSANIDSLVHAAVEIANNLDLFISNPSSPLVGIALYPPLPLPPNRKRKANETLSREKLNKIAKSGPVPSGKKLSFDQKECPICLESYMESIRILPCKHAFHSQCIETWTEKGKATCPVCKINLI